MTGRDASLDIARGLAILGTFATNVWVFTHPDGLLGTVLSPLAGGIGSALAQALPLGKSLALLSLLFGVGLELQRRSAARRGVSWNRTHRVRAGVLFAEAGVHFLLIAEFDVLMGYAVAALLAAPVLTWSDRGRRRTLVVLLTVHAVALTALVLVLNRAPLGAGTGADLRTPYADGSFTDLVLFRLDNLAVFRAEPVGLLLLSTASFVLGAELVRCGLLDPDRVRLRRGLMGLGVLGLVLEAVFLALGGGFGVLLTRYGSAVLVALGVLALVVQAHTGSRPRWLGRRLAEVGRTALSCYVLQNLLAGALCYGWGLGLATRSGVEHRAAVTAVVFVLVAGCVVAFAHAVARAGRAGPLEALSARVQRRLLPAPAATAARQDVRS
ncbi:DUF418 domain-containing protein [Kineococcus sp. SYSU DK001]|uniref:DUF418 domain-containing protein n=1 Tax=Kineococcus sp. SYSU DK001 TaxID=3383122 RepID=UPI003D7E1A86